ncbi:ZCF TRANSCRIPTION FACTORS [Heracleum sosnowskyi]|uniref:ZCF TRANSCRIPTION FACTORS n=1 Tax=Heracleum sosnowskyi TaxID=360622 RepID=A0AAD8N2D8_9APIA|nr:ZCF TRANSCRIPTION FACTORS [Heracleum sosnowskyi]
MISPLICGSFHDQPDEDLELLRSCTSPKSRKPTKWHSFGGKSSKGNKNPYADRGLDKFSALLAELDSKRQKIYTQKGSEDISLLGFAYSNSNDYKPIVVRLKNKKQPIIRSEKDKPNTTDVINSPPATSSEIEPAKADQVRAMSRIVSNIKISPEKIMSFDLLKNIVVENSKQPAYYVPIITILILIFLIVFGRSFAILCTTLCWYFVLMIQSFDYKKPKTPKTIKTPKKDYAKALSYSGNLTTTRDHEISNLKKTKIMKKAMSYNNKFVKTGTSDNGLSSPRSVLNGYKSPPTPASPPQDHRRTFPR